MWTQVAWPLPIWKLDAAEGEAVICMSAVFDLECCGMLGLRLCVCWLAADGSVCPGVLAASVLPNAQFLIRKSSSLIILFALTLSFGPFCPVVSAWSVHQVWRTRSQGRQWPVVRLVAVVRLLADLRWRSHVQGALLQQPQVCTRANIWYSINLLYPTRWCQTDDKRGSLRPVRPILRWKLEP